MLPHGNFPSLVTMDSYGVVQQISHVPAHLQDEVTPDDVVGSHISRWKAADQLVGRTLISRKPSEVHEIEWHEEQSGRSGRTRCLYMRLAPTAAVVAATMQHQRFTKLTPLEIGVVDRLASGATHAEISAGLYRSPAAVSSCVNRVRHKLSARTTAHAVAVCVRCGLV